MERRSKFRASWRPGRRSWLDSRPRLIPWQSPTTPHACRCRRPTSTNHGKTAGLNRFRGRDGGHGSAKTGDKSAQIVGMPRSSGVATHGRLSSAIAGSRDGASWTRQWADPPLRSRVALPERRACLTESLGARTRRFGGGAEGDAQRQKKSVTYLRARNRIRTPSIHLMNRAGTYFWQRAPRYMPTMPPSPNSTPSVQSGATDMVG